MITSENRLNEIGGESKRLLPKIQEIKKLLGVFTDTVFGYSYETVLQSVDYKDTDCIVDEILQNYEIVNNQMIEIESLLKRILAEAGSKK